MLSLNHCWRFELQIETQPIGNSITLYNVRREGSAEFALIYFFFLFWSSNKLSIVYHSYVVYHSMETSAAHQNRTNWI